jgi:hypothetical protein
LDVIDIVELARAVARAGELGRGVTVVDIGIREVLAALLGVIGVVSDRAETI